ncbi:MAG: hypothetical protein FJZ01_07470 [Candidatus Sericytochromatia bacterium]|nr:hypothetical protein [Candidatus Tanganyikabacteria bacterium]
MRFLVAVSAFASVLAVGGCGGAPPGAASVGSGAWRALALELDPYPAEIGRHWSYDTWHSQNHAAERPGKPQRFEIAASAGDGTVMRRFYGDREAPATLVRKTDGAVALSRHQPDGPPASESITVLRLPLVAGASWAGRNLAGATERIRVVGRETVTVPAGTFAAWHVAHDLTYAAGGGDRLEYWYAGGVGMVQAIERITLQSGSAPYPLQVRAVLAVFGR